MNNILLAINKNNNNIAVFCNKLEKDVLERFCNYSSDKDKGESQSFFKAFLFSLAQEKEFFTESGEQPSFNNILEQYNVGYIFTYFEDTHYLRFAYRDVENPHTFISYGVEEYLQSNKSLSLYDFLVTRSQDIAKENNEFYTATHRTQGNLAGNGDNSSEIAKHSESRGDTTRYNRGSQASDYIGFDPSNREGITDTLQQDNPIPQQKNELFEDSEHSLFSSQETEQDRDTEYNAIGLASRSKQDSNANIIERESSQYPETSTRTAISGRIDSLLQSTSLKRVIEGVLFGLVGERDRSSYQQGRESDADSSQQEVRGNKVNGNRGSGEQGNLFGADSNDGKSGYSASDNGEWDIAQERRERGYNRDASEYSIRGDNQRDYQINTQSLEGIQNALSSSAVADKFSNSQGEFYRDGDRAGEQKKSSAFFTQKELVGGDGQADPELLQEQRVLGSEFQIPTNNEDNIDGIFYSKARRQDREVESAGESSYQSRTQNVEQGSTTGEVGSYDEAGGASISELVQGANNNLEVANTKSEVLQELPSEHKKSHGFQTFSRIEFLKKLDSKGYRGEIEFNLSKAERIRANLESIRLTQKIFSENRLIATPQEQEILAKFSGFGGLSEVFTDEKYQEEQIELQEILGDKLYRDASFSSFNAYYTPKDIIDSMYDGLMRMGVSKNEKIKALEPSCGIGYFIARAPENYEFEAVEKDLLTATIAKFLHPQVKIHNKGFEEVHFGKEFDVVVGNPPYEDIRIYDENTGNKEMIHNYFVSKSQSLLKEQGLSSFVITSGFLDSRSNAHRVSLARDSMLVSAFRLPNEAFKATHTSVLSDIVFLQKVENIDELEKRLQNSAHRNMVKDTIDIMRLNAKLMQETIQQDIGGKQVLLNRYFAMKHWAILGDVSTATNQFGDSIMHVKADRRFYDLQKSIAEGLDNHFDGLFSLQPANQSNAINLEDFDLSDEKITYIDNLRIGNIFELEGKIYIKEQDSACSEVFFSDEIGIDKKYLFAPDEIISETKKNIVYKHFLNTSEVEIAKQIISFRDVLKENLKNEQELPNDEPSNTLILEQKRYLRELRRNILTLSGATCFNANGQKKYDENKIVIKHTLKNIIDLERLESYRIYSAEDKIREIKNGRFETRYQVSDVLNKRILYPFEKTEAKDAVEALQKTINEVGKIDEAILQSYLPNIPIVDILKELSQKELIFPDLETKRSYVLKPKFLSGNIKTNYETIKKMMADNENFALPFVLGLEVYASFLQRNFPQDIRYEDLEVSFGANFVDIDIYEEFIRESFFNNPQNIKVQISRLDSAYIIEHFSKMVEENGVAFARTITDNDLNDLGLNLRVFSETNAQTPYFDLRDMLERTINNQSLVVMHTEKTSNEVRTIVEPIPTKMALDSSENIKDMFLDYVFRNKIYRDKIEKQYNKQINVFSHGKLEYQNFLEMPTLNKEITLRKHQDNAIFKGIINKSMLFDHQVGAGKTLVAIALTMEQIRMGLVKKALILVPNHLCGQWGNEFLKAYPNAKLLIGDKIASKKDRKEFLYRSRNGDFDAIIMKHSTFENMNVMQTYEKEVLAKEIDSLRKSISNEANLKNKQILRRTKKLEARLDKIAKSKSYDNEIAFEELGIDCLIVDEAHSFKNLFIDTAQAGIKGLPLTQSKKAFKMYCATQYMHKNNFKLYFLTGTPVSNSIAEFYTMQRYIQPHILKGLNLTHFDDWQKTFTRIVMNEELDSSGINYTLVARLSKFINTPELMNFYKQNADVVTNEDIEKISGRLVPKIRGGKAINIVSPRSEAIASFIGIEDENGQYNAGSIIDRMNNWHENPSRNNVLVCTSEARKAALDFRLIDPQANDYQESKLNKLVEKIKEHYEDNRYEKSTQLVFCDLGISKLNSQKIDVSSVAVLQGEGIEDVANRLGLEFYIETDEEGNEVDSYWVEYKQGKGHEKREIERKYSYFDLIDNQINFDVYSEVLKKLVRSGIPQKQIAFIGDASNDKQKQDLFDKVNAGEVRILIGSTAKMGAGTNVQQRVVALHELDCPWRPSDLEQRAGRVIRQGNIFFEMDKDNFEIAHYRYATEQTYDARMFQINEQKLLPLIQIKKNDVLAEQRVFDSIDAEMVNISEMKAIATGNPFILEKHKIQKYLTQEERYLEHFKKSITANERILEDSKRHRDTLLNELDAINEVFNNKEFNKENYEVEILGIKTTKKAKFKEEEELFKRTRVEIGKKLMQLENEPEKFFDGMSELEVLKANQITLVFKVGFGVNQEIFFTGIIQTQNGKRFTPNNLSFKVARSEIRHQSLVLDGLLERLKNTFEKIASYMDDVSRRLKDKEGDILRRTNFLESSDLSNYERRPLLDTLKQDLRNLNEIMNIRNKLRKEGVRIDMQSEQIKHLLPKYPLLLDDKNKFIGVQKLHLDSQEEQQMREKNQNERIALSDEQQETLNYIKTLDENLAKIAEVSIDFQKFSKKDTLEVKVEVLKENQHHIASTTRSREFYNAFV